MQGVVVQSETMRANVVAADVADTNTAAEASHVFAGTHAADMATAAEASHVTSAAKAAAHMAAATEAAAVTATAATATAGIGRAHHQARSEKSCCENRDHPFHHDTPFQSDCSAP
jgi:predicted urease superfamily metal-dependent hydrolase